MRLVLSYVLSAQQGAGCPGNASQIYLNEQVNSYELILSHGVTTSAPCALNGAECTARTQHSKQKPQGVNLLGRPKGWAVQDPA